MKLATLKDGTRDGQLIVVSRDMQTAAIADAIAPAMQRVLEDWHFYAPQLRTLYESLNGGRVRRSFKFDAKACMAPLPRAWRCIDATCALPASPQDRAGDAAASHRFVVRRGDASLGARDDLHVARDDCRLTLRSGVAALMADVVPGAAPMEAVASVRLLTLFASFQSPTAAAGGTPVDGAFDARAYDLLAFAPVAVTPDVFGDEWHHGVLRRRPDVKINGQRVAGANGASAAVDAGAAVSGAADAAPSAGLRTELGGFATLGALLAREHAIGAGTIVLGAPALACPEAQRLVVGDRVVADLRDDKGVSYCGPIETSIAPRGEAAED